MPGPEPSSLGFTAAAGSDFSSFTVSLPPVVPGTNVSVGVDFHGLTSGSHGWAEVVLSFIVFLFGAYFMGLEGVQVCGRYVCGCGLDVASCRTLLHHTSPVFFWGGS